MTALELRTFGGVALLDAGSRLDRAAVNRKPLALLVLLAGAGIQGWTRDKLMAYLWPEASDERARNVLRQTMYALRRDLRAPELFLSSATALRLNPAVIRTDLAAYTEAMAAREWTVAVELYQGPFLDGFHLSDAPEFEEWVEGRRRELEEDLRRALGRLAHRAEETGDHAAAAGWWRRLSRHDPLNSRVIVDLMNALDHAGEPALALEAARSHAELLRAELGTGTDAAVVEVAARISARLSSPQPPTQPQIGPDRSLPPMEVREPDRGPAATTRARGGIRRRTLATAVAIVGLAGLSLTQPAAVIPPRAAPMLPGDVRTVAVLPFTDSSASRDGRYLGPPLTEELRRRLAGISSLRVVGLAGDDLPSRLIALRADVTLAGTVRADDGQLELSLRLTDAATGRLLWARTHSGERAELPAVQSIAAREVAAALGAPITQSERRRIEQVPTSDAGAYDLYLRSAALSHINRVENLAGIALLQQSVQRDSTFAFALAMLARRFMFQAYLVDPAFSDSGMAAVRRALAIDPDLGTSHFALGDLQGLAGQPSAARLSYLRAIDLDPAELPAMVDLSDVDASLGRYDEALYWALRAVRLDPTSPGFRSHVAVALYLLGNDEVTERWLLDAERRWPDYERFPIGLARLDYRRGNEAAALQRLRVFISRHQGNEEAAVALAAFAALSGAPDGERLVAERLRVSPDAVPYGPGKASFRALLALTRRRRGDVAGARAVEDTAFAVAHAMATEGREESSFSIELAALHALRGEAAALDWLERASAAGEREYRWLAIDPVFAGFRNHPRFVHLLARMEADVTAMRERAVAANDTIFRAH